MLFNSISYAFFLPIVFGIYWLLPEKFRWIIILVSSYYFYMSWNASYVLLILFTTGISYATALAIQGCSRIKYKKWLMSLAISICLLMLVFFKYFNFFTDIVDSFLRLFYIKVHPVTLKLLLPVGISFYTFQTLSYVIDVYQGKIQPERNFGKYAAFISFFPQLVAGPIERASDLMPQICGSHKFSYDEATYGLKLMAWGFFKKLVIADNLAFYVDKFYAGLDTNNVPISSWGGSACIIATIFFSLQIYCDFSGYSDIAMGTAKLLDIKLSKNFNSPYFSSSVKEFWSRWHISLSTWFRDYVYIPLGGNRCGKLKHKVNLILTFLLSGLWHGSNWTFILWGGIHGVAQVIESSFSKEKANLKRKWYSVLIVFIFCNFTWVFFRANSVSQAFLVFNHMLDGFLPNPLQYLKTGFYNLGIGKIRLLEICSFISVLFVYDFINIKKDVIYMIGKLPRTIRWTIYYMFLGFIIYFGSFASSQFVYFQF